MIRRHRCFLQRAFFIDIVCVLFALSMACSPTRVPEPRLDEQKRSVQTKEDAQSYVQRGLRFMDRGETEKAILAFQKALTLNAKSVVAHNNLGALLKLKGNFESAQKHYQQAIALTPSSAESYYNLGILLRELGKFREAEKAYLEAVRIHHDFAPAYYNLGILYDLYLNEPDEAIKSFVHYLEIEGDQRERIEAWILDLEKRLKKN